ncbi:MAG TPA: serine/threonine-protein kinase [Pyrinomonadaceae bacterium]|jgi:serine/threonine-protein kinase
MRACPEDGTALRADATQAVRIPSDPLVGRVLDGKYRLDERLGEGGMGTVYRATHLLIERPVAVKVLNVGLVTNEEAKERFRREARAAGRLRHANAVAVTDFGESPDGLVYIVMELLEGDSLRDVMAREAPFEPERAVSLMSQISAAVGAAHEAGIIHRDLKPANIFLVSRQQQHGAPLVKVLDFGIAKLAADSLEEFESHTLTQTGIMIGTPRYMSPEQCDGAKLTPASDVYSLAIILYEMLTGATPFTGTSPLAVALQHSSKQPRAPRELIETIPPALEELILQALEKRPEERPANACEFRAQLQAIAEQLGLEGVSPRRPTRAEILDDVVETPAHSRALDVSARRQSQPSSKATTARGIAVTKAQAAGDTTALAETNGKQRALKRASASSANAAAHKAPVNGITRFRIFLDGKQTWLQKLRQPPLLVGVGLAGLLLTIGVFALVAGRREPSPFKDAQVAATATQMPTPTPTPAPLREERSRRTPEKRPARRTDRPQQQQKKPSKIDSILNKAKKIFKNPF